jgi:hypothetical protein
MADLFCLIVIWELAAEYEGFHIDVDRSSGYVRQQWLNITPQLLCSMTIHDGMVCIFSMLAKWACRIDLHSPLS